jgi:energy-coupling factor transporter ATP-binding protein EcfA2
MAAVLSAVELTKRFGDVTAVDALSFEVEAGTVTGFLGPNGAGKTTTLRMLLGLAEPTHGRALVFGRRFAELELRRHASAPCSRPPTCTRAAAAVITSGSWRVPLACPAPDWRTSWRWSNWATRPIAAWRATRSGCASGSALRLRCSAIPSC